MTEKQFDRELRNGYPTYYSDQSDNGYTATVRFFSEKLCEVTEISTVDGTIKKCLSMVESDITGLILIFSAPDNGVHVLTKDGDDFWTLIPNRSGYYGIKNLPHRI